MAIGDPPVTVQELIDKVTASTANIDKHRAAMAAVAVAAKQAQPSPPPVTEAAK